MSPVVIIQILMGLLLALGMFILSSIQKNLEELTKATTAIKDSLLKDYLPRSDFEIYRKETRETIHEIRNKVHNCEALLIRINKMEIIP